jgi:hypothetical protein
MAEEDSIPTQYTVPRDQLHLLRYDPTDKLCVFLYDTARYCYIRDLPNGNIFM